MSPGLQLSNGLLPVDPKGFYAVFTAPDSYYSSFCVTGGFCGWHSSLYYGGQSLAYAFLGSPDTVSAALRKRQKRELGAVPSSEYAVKLPVGIS